MVFRERPPLRTRNVPKWPARRSVRGLHESGDLYEKGTYLAGAFHGPREWYLNDRLIELVTYEQGRIDGPYERYTAKGELDLRGTLQDGQPCGTWLEDDATITYPGCALES